MSFFSYFGQLLNFDLKCNKEAEIDLIEAGSEMDGENILQCHVLTYEDKEGDWLMVGDVPWE